MKRRGGEALSVSGSGFGAHSDWLDPKRQFRLVSAEAPCNEPNGQGMGPARQESAGDQFPDIH